MKIIGCELEGIYSVCERCPYRHDRNLCEGIREANSWQVYYKVKCDVNIEKIKLKKIKDRIKGILYDTTRDVARLVNHLEYETDFFEAPASTKHHLARVGGLAEHSLSVYETMVELKGTFELDIPWHQIAITGILHDLCKTGYYVEVQKWRKDDYGKWESYTAWGVEDELPLGHGEKSLYLVNKYLTLSDEEAAAIRWHMGCWTAGVTTDRGLSSAFNDAAEKYPLVSLLISADYISTRLLEDK